MICQLARWNSLFSGRIKVHRLTDLGLFGVSKNLFCPCLTGKTYYAINCYWDLLSVKSIASPAITYLWWSPLWLSWFFERIFPTNVGFRRIVVDAEQRIWWFLRRSDGVCKIQILLVGFDFWRVWMQHLDLPVAFAWYLRLVMDQKTLLTKAANRRCLWRKSYSVKPE